MYEIRPESIKTFIEDGSIKLPRFQRKQTWNEKKNFQLCISLFKEYPLGVCILNVERDSEHITKWLLDGRQRRNALSKFYLDPENVYAWAKKFIKFPSGCQIQELEEKYWSAINEYLEDDELVEKNEEEDSSQVDTSSGFKEKIESTGLDLLLKIVKLVHNKTRKHSGFTRPFDFTNLITALPYVDNTVGYSKLNSQRIRSFVDSYKIHCRDNSLNYLEKESFDKFFVDRFEISESLMQKVSIAISHNWSNILDRIKILDRIDELLMNAKIGIIEVKNLSSVDAQKIFNIINTGGTKLTAVEILSAKPSWNVAIQNPSTDLLQAARILYDRIGTTTYEGVVKWDLPATVLGRLEHSSIFFNEFTSSQTGFGKELTLGFKLMSGIFQGGITKENVDSLSKNSSSDWVSDYESLINHLNLMTKIVLEYDYFKYLRTWKISVINLLSDACALNYFLLLFKDWERKDKPIGNNLNTRKFQKNAFILLDKLIYEYVTRDWRGSSDSKIAKNLLEMSDAPDIYTPLPKEKWIALLHEIFDYNTINGNPITSTAAVSPILYHSYFLKRLSGSDTENSIEIDHIIPQAYFGTSTIENKDIKHNLFNLGLLPKNENASKNNKLLIGVTSPWLKDQITKYEFIPQDKFSLFSDIGNIDTLRQYRKKIFIQIYSEYRDNVLNT